MINGNKFGSPAWRSPLTGSTSEEIKEKREIFARNVACVTKQVTEERDRLAALKENTDE
jgi:hypothetical protein